MPAAYPFTAIIGQETMQTALLINAVDPAVGGVLVRGQKGTAKSTAARALAALLPGIEVVPGCPYHCDPDNPGELHSECREKHTSGETLRRESLLTPFVDLPLSTTEDRLVGTLDLRNTLQTGQRHFAPGLLAAAHRGILYVDEVNLLPDHLVDLLLDTAASGINLVEREGLQFRHAARFMLIGTMNPEEGELRPQFVDRFGLCVSIAGLEDTAQRRLIVLRRLAYDRDPESFCKDFLSSEKALRQQVLVARKRLGEVLVPAEIVDRAVIIAAGAKTQGHRAELALVRAARALAALLDRDSVSRQNLDAVAGLALAHRLPDAPVLSPAEVGAKIAGLLETEAEQPAPVAGKEQCGTTDDELELLENMDFPGAAAAGSMLFTYLKKKLTTSSSVPTTPST